MDDQEQQPKKTKKVLHLLLVFLPEVFQQPADLEGSGIITDLKSYFLYR